MWPRNETDDMKLVIRETELFMKTEPGFESSLPSGCVKMYKKLKLSASHFLNSDPYAVNLLSHWLQATIDPLSITTFLFQSFIQTESGSM